MAGDEGGGSQLGALAMFLWSAAAWAFWLGLRTTGLGLGPRIAVVAAVVLALAVLAPRVEALRRCRRKQRRAP